MKDTVSGLIEFFAVTNRTRAPAKFLVTLNMRKMRQIDSTRIVLMSHGASLASPYLGARGKTVVLRGAGTGAHNENVDFAADYKRAFGGAPEALVGFAVSADSDDTDSTIVAKMSGLTVK